jgi:UDP-N-acetyl-D-mannosaminuronic acid dehydrogenase
MASGFKRDVGVIGGGGHVGLPLAITFADCGLKTLIFDINDATIASIRAGKMPFEEDGGPEALNRALKNGNLDANTTSRM